MRAIATAVSVLTFLACVGDNPDASSSSSSSSGASASGGPASIQCGNAKCAGGQVCCVTVENGNVTDASCKATADCTTSALLCDDASDCAAGEICCVANNGHSAAWRASTCSKTACPDSGDQLCAASSECGTKQCAPTPSFVRPENLKSCQ